MSPRTTAALIAAAALASPAMGFAPGALPQFGAHRRGLRESSSSAGAVKMGLFDSILGKKEKDTSGPVVFKEWSQKDVVDGPKGAGLQGDIACLFKIGDEEKPTTAFAGQPLSDVATQANAFIPYKCKKGECGTCDVLINGKWVHACQTTIPSMAKGEVFQVNIREGKVQAKKASGFFSAQSFVDGFTNNALGVVGFVNEGIKEEDNFNVRMEREKEMLAKVAAKKAAKEAAKNQ
eukprot:CAMPEP_0179427970 /NCGR_PEP_ID=MMETSP0799-20121207/13772_1 /TAXON_ID=46947 /ORGANISM="Geminigera cryophila, Strain CCMP2564" /LENGTH=234 /DNA_ID=CAMNT_0021203257 /DNA_START=10 /DNA_END=714 /DNA_ORIENTATION=+